MSYCKVIIVGNVGKDPNIRSMQNGKEIANLTVATSDKWKDKSGEWKQKTEWHNVVIFSEGLVKVVQSYVKKGSKLLIEGSLQTRKWQDKNGNDKYTTEIVLQGFNSKLVMLDKREQSESAPAEPVPYSNEPEDLDDEIPF